MPSQPVFCKHSVLSVYLYWTFFSLRYLSRMPLLNEVRSICILAFILLGILWASLFGKMRGKGLACLLSWEFPAQESVPRPGLQGLLGEELALFLNY